MPLYEYQCLPHAHRFEVRHGITDQPVKTCPECGGDVRRVIHPVGIVFKGSGFYATDSRQPTKEAKSPQQPSSDSKKETASSGASDTSSTGDSSAKT